MSWGRCWTPSSRAAGAADYLHYGADGPRSVASTAATRAGRHGSTGGFHFAIGPSAARCRHSGDRPGGRDTGHLAALDPAAPQKLDSHEIINIYTTMHGAPAKILRSGEQIATERAAAAQQQRMQEIAQLGLAGVKGAELLSKTNVGGGQNALQMIAGQE